MWRGIVWGIQFVWITVIIEVTIFIEELYDKLTLFHWFWVCLHFISCWPYLWPNPIFQTTQEPVAGRFPGLMNCFLNCSFPPSSAYFHLWLNLSSGWWTKCSKRPLWVNFSWRWWISHGLTARVTIRKVFSAVLEGSFTLKIWC